MISFTQARERAGCARPFGIQPDNSRNVLLRRDAEALPAGQSLMGVADFNRDGHLDYALFNTSTAKQRSGIYQDQRSSEALMAPPFPVAGDWWLQPILTATVNRTMCFTRRARVKQRCGI